MRKLGKVKFFDLDFFSLVEVKEALSEKSAGGSANSRADWAGMEVKSSGF